MTVEQLQKSGLERMDDAAICEFVSSQDAGVLGLQDEGVPYLLPMSFGYDGGETLYFTYVLGEDSRKERLTERTERATFLVYNTTSAFQWESVLLTGAIERLPEVSWGDFEAVMQNAWRPDVFERAESGEAKVYQFHIEDQQGYRHTGLPPGFVEE